MTRSQVIDRQADGAHGFPYPLDKPARPATHEQHRIAAESQAWRRARHLRLNGFGSMLNDGTDPGAFAWAILEAEARLSACAETARIGLLHYPASLHYTIAQAPKGYGFPGAGINLARNLPLGTNPSVDRVARNAFNDAIRSLRVSPDELAASVRVLCNHAERGRVREGDHALLARRVACAEAGLPWRAIPLRPRLTPRRCRRWTRRSSPSPRPTPRCAEHRMLISRPESRP